MSSPNNLVRTEFDVTVLMSTYLLALVVSDFECKLKIETGVGEQGSIEVRVCGREEAVTNGQLDYALEVAVNVIKFYEDFYGVKYPLPKAGLFIFFCFHLSAFLFKNLYFKIMLPFQTFISMPWKIGV